MSAVERLPLRVKRPRKAVPESDWSKLRDEAAAVRYAVQESNLQDKSIAWEADIDPAILSKAKSGQARLSDEDRMAFSDATGSEALLYQVVLAFGYDPRTLRKLESETERQLRETNEALEAERVKVRVLTQALTGRPPG